ncbi:C-x8-C-x5-C-x3-H type zinc finger protein [Colletotrichum tofieldiae]|nr:C-X8-C-X5-C-X3-H type zinc finger protein [Colletotrichum tofieldiae]GKT67990.1 C-x8-C-x5-C-x3-H type zinc finger protein [Colletotrichum tofieldiae]
MQNWQPNGQAGSPQAHNNMWSGPYGFPDGSTQFDASQNWQHQLPNQNAFPHIGARGNSAESNLYASPHQSHATVATEHNNLSALNHGNFHDSHSQFSLDTPYTDAGQEDALAGLNDFPQDMYGQPGKADFTANIDNLNHGHTPDFTQQQFQYNGQANQLFNGNVPQYTDAQLMPQHGHQTSAQLQQRFDSVPQSYSPAPQGYVPSPQQHQAQPERVFSQSPHPFQAQQPHQQSNPGFSNPTPPPFQQNQAAPYQQHKFVPQQMAYPQPAARPAFQPVAAKQMPDQESTPQHTPQPLPQQQPVHQAKAVPSPARTVQPQQEQQPHLQPIAAAPASQPGTPTIDPALQPEPLKKRKRVTKKEGEAERSDSPNLKRDEDGETLVLPSSTEEEIAVMEKFKKRSAASKKQFPPIPGASFLVSSGTVKLAAPKSYDRLAPLVALPSPSGRPILPELGRDLPCEIQGRFTDKYRPSMNFVGQPGDRETEAKALIEQYGREMGDLKSGRPKYSEFPFTFQEQLKADEAAKSKAQRKARKEEEEERKRPIRPETRPADPVEAAVWDILGIVYIDPSATRTTALLGTAVQGLGEFLVKLRSEVNRLKQEVDQANKEKKPASVIAEWNSKMDLKREIFTKVCEAAAKHGDEAVLENFGGHQKGILSLVNMLIGCIKAADFSGLLPKALLRFMSNISIHKKVAEAVNFENVRKRFADKGDDEVKELVRTIASRIKKDAEPINGVEVKKTPSTGPVSKTLKPATKPLDGSPAKRARDDDSDSRTTKKVATESTNNALGNKLGAKPAAGSLQSKFGATKPRPNASTSLAGKIRAPAPKSGARDPIKPEPSKFEGTTSSAMDVDKKLVASAPPKPESKVPAAKAVATSGLASSSIASLLDSINTPKADGPSTQPKDSGKKDISETAEEKENRLRKEARRKLRVSWKPESELVQVRIFHKEAAEDQDNMTKDAADDRSEGMMLKQRSYNEDEDEDEDLPEKPWVKPALANMSRIPQDYRDKSFVTRGGNLTFHTEEQKVTEEREKKELMVTYMDISDIPPTPKSPPPESAQLSSEGKTSHLPQGDPKYEEIHKRWKETQQFGWEAAGYYARKRLDAQDDPATKLNSILGNLKPIAPAVEPEPYNMTPPKENAQPILPHAAEMQPVPAIPFDDKVYEILTSDKAKNWQDPNPFNPAAPQTHRRYDYPDLTIQAAADNVEEAAESLRGLPYPATSPPAWLANNQERLREWWAGYQKDSATRAKREAGSKARVEPEVESQSQQPAPQTQEQKDAWAAYYQQQEQQYAQYMAMLQGGQPQQPAHVQPVQPVQAAPAPSLAGDTQLQAILAQMGQQPTSQANVYGLNPQDTSYQQLMMLAQLQQQQQQPQQQQQQAAPPPPPPPPPPAGSQSPPNHDQTSFKPPHLQRQLVDYSDRDTRDELEQQGGRERDRERGRDREREGKGGKQGKNRKGNAPGGATLAPHRPVNRALIGTKPCSFWQQGKCARGDKCTFRHDT